MFGNETANAIRESFKGLTESGDKAVTYFVPLRSDDEKNNWAVCLAWMDYDNTNDWQVYGKVAFQPKNSLMQEYDIDWLMPCDEATGDVDDTELSVYDLKDLESAISWWGENWDRIRNSLESEPAYMAA